MQLQGDRIVLRLQEARTLAALGMKELKHLPPHYAASCEPVVKALRDLVTEADARQAREGVGG